MASLPAWMHHPAADAAAIPPQPRRRGVVRRGLAELLRLLGLLLDDRLAARPGLLQAIDARVKAPALIGLMVVATLLHGLPALGALYALALALAALSRIPITRVLGAWLVMPLVSALVVLPAALNVFTPGAPLLPLWGSLAVTDAGCYVAARLVLRTLACVTLTLLLVATTPPARLFHGLRALGVPRVAVMLLAMMARYLVVLARAAEEIHLARLSRTLAPGTLRQEQAWVAAGMGALFRRAHALGEDVYLAMLARGYTGDAPLLAPPRLGWRDGVFLAGIMTLAAGILLLDWLWR